MLVSLGMAITTLQEGAVYGCVASTHKGRAMLDQRRVRCRERALLWRGRPFGNVQRARFGLLPRGLAPCPSRGGGSAAGGEPSTPLLLRAL